MVYKIINVKVDVKVYKIYMLCIFRDFFFFLLWNGSKESMGETKLKESVWLNA